jgi:hypothetical protein
MCRLPDNAETASLPGTPVPQWDWGRIAVGNGAAFSHWVRDDIRAHVVCLEDVDDKILVVLSAGVYMLLEPDLEIYYHKVREAVGPEIAPKLFFIAHAQHNHHGPDTSGLGGPINRKYFEFMLDMFTEATMEALDKMEPARIDMGQTVHRFGLEDKRDPLVFDYNLQAARVTALNDESGPPIATIVSFAMHPEVTLNINNPPDLSDSECAAAGLDPGCDIKGAYLTGDFPGELDRQLKMHHGGGETIFLNGAIGLLMQPWGPVWEITEEHPIGDGVQIPEGASNIPRNFLRQLNIGREMAKAVLSITESGPSDLLSLPDVPMEFKESREYSRLSNWLFRAGLSPRSVLPRNINLELTQVECLLENDCLDIDLESPVDGRTGLGACLVNNECVQMDADGNLDIGT